MKFCPYCGAGLKIVASFCPECGKKISGAAELGRKKSGRHVSSNSVESVEEIVPEQEIAQISPEETEREYGEPAEEGRAEMYDGYYDDVLPPDADRSREGPDMTLIRKVSLVAGGVLLVIALCLAALYFM